jgi:predicted nucleic acid-binding protein
VLQAYEQNVFGGRVLTVDRTCAYAYGRVVAERQRRGRPIDVMDALIAAVALVHEATLATRNLADFDGLGIALVNPFELA